MRTAILASGNLGLSCINTLPDFVEIVCVMTDSKSTGIIEWANTRKVPLFKGNPRAETGASFIQQFEVEVLFSINYLFVIGKDIIDAISKYAFNIHGSLLPKYRGRTPHVWSIINNERLAGLTVHIIDEGCDTGDIVLQKVVEITPEMTGADLLQEYERLYPQAISEVFTQARTSNVNVKKQDHTLATYFGKRTPEDGEVDWNWQKERIKNWVRAQARPYPGAFTFFNGDKVVIHSVTEHDLGFDYEEPNGKILGFQNGMPIIKTPNGALVLSDLETETEINFIKGELLHARH